MLPTRTESPARDPRSPTPRAQLARVVVGGLAALVLGAGPAVAWDLSTQPPRAEARSPWPRPSPWLTAGKQMKASAGGIARIYLPRDKAPPADSANPAGAVVSPSPAAATATPSTGPLVISIPVPYRGYRR